LSKQRRDEVISHIQTFRDYFHYHIKASKVRYPLSNFFRELTTDNLRHIFTPECAGVQLISSKYFGEHVRRTKKKNERLLVDGRSNKAVEIPSSWVTKTQNQFYHTSNLAMLYVPWSIDRYTPTMDPNSVYSCMNNVLLCPEFPGVVVLNCISTFPRVKFSPTTLLRSRQELVTNFSSLDYLVSLIFSNTLFYPDL